MRTGLAVSVAMFLLLGAGLSCSDDPPAAGGPVDAGPDGPPPLSPEASSFVTDFCAVNQPCCAAVKGAGNKCITETHAEGGGKVFDAAKAKACLEALRAEAKGVKYCGRGPDMITCAGVFKITNAKGPGESCHESSECANGPDSEGLCVGSSDSPKCRQVKRGKEGDACFGTRSEGKTDELVNLPDGANALCFVSDGLHCDATTAKCAKRGDVGASCSSSVGACVDAAYCKRDTNQCTARTAQGAKCTDSEECVSGYQCANNGAGGGACIALAGEGGACIRGDECDPAASLVCDSFTTKCVPDVTVYELTCSGAAALLK